MTMNQLELASIAILTDFLEKPPVHQELLDVLENIEYGYDTDVSELLHETFSYVYEPLYQQSILSFIYEKDNETRKILLHNFVINNRNKIIFTYHGMKSCGYETNYGIPNFAKAWNYKENLQILTDVTRFHAERILLNKMLSLTDTTGLVLKKTLSKANLPYSFENGSSIDIKNKKGIEKFFSVLQTMKEKATMERKTVWRDIKPTN